MTRIRPVVVVNPMLPLEFYRAWEVYQVAMNFDRFVPELMNTYGPKCTSEGYKLYSRNNSSRNNGGLLWYTDYLRSAAYRTQTQGE